MVVVNGKCGNDDNIYKHMLDGALLSKRSNGLGFARKRESFST